MKYTTPLYLLVCLIGLRPAIAQQPATDNHPFVSPLFTDGMVLQRDRRDPVWGWTTPGAQVTVTAEGKTANATAGSDGYWKAELPKLSLGDPFDLTVTGPQTVTFHNVVVGDVWICSGQSNMEFGIGNIVNPDTEINQANYPDIRLFRVVRNASISPQTVVGDGGGWETCTPDNVRKDGIWNGFSAVAYFFGRELHQNLHVPIGLIHTSWGGTPAESWTSEEALAKVPDFHDTLAMLDAERVGGDHWLDNSMNDFYQKNDPGSAPGKEWFDPALSTSDWSTMALPCVFQHVGVPELASFNGIIWYRREIVVPADPTGKTAVLHLGPIDDDDTTYVNGVEVGRITNDASAHRDYTLPAGVLKQGTNVIAIRLFDRGGTGGVDGVMTDMHLDIDGMDPIRLDGFWNYKISTPLNKLPAPPRRIGGDPYSAVNLYNGMIAPVIPYGIKGAIWYQGEANAGRAMQYRTLLPTMIADWRNRWREGDFPFLIVQLAGWQPGGDSWASLREAQWLTARNGRNVGIATAIDIGDQSDIHPKNKQEVGRRLGLVAESQVYREKVESSGPVYKSMAIEASTIRISFDYLAGGLVMKGDSLTGFSIAGADQKFVDAVAKIDGDTVVVSSPDVASPVAVRYARSAYPSCSLYNQAGLPAFPFRTDTWPEAN